MGAEPDFGGWATKANIKCSDGRIILPGAFEHQDTSKVPLVWQHGHGDSDNVLGYAVLQHREGEGVYCHGYFNSTPKGQNAKAQVEHGDIEALSIFANRLVEKSKVVSHGNITEVSLVLAGANKGAKIDYVNIQHGDGSVTELDDAAVIFTGLEVELTHADDEEAEEADVQHTDTPKTIEDVFNTLNDEQKDVVYYLLSKAVDGDKVAHADDEMSNDVIQHTFESFDEDQELVVHYLISKVLAHAEDSTTADADTDTTAAHADTQEGTSMTNVFESQTGTVKTGTSLSHADQAIIFKDAARRGSLKDAVEAYATDTLQHGIEDIDILFPDARAITATPEWIKRRTEWVSKVLTGTRHTPFARIKSLTANLTHEEARAKGYIKGNFKKEEFFGIAKRVTTPQTIYKKQQLDRDDIVDITDFDVVAWLKGEMRLMLEEEIARAVLVGDGRSNADTDKISEEHVRPIATDNELFVTRLYVNLGNAGSSAEEIIDAVTMNRRHYRGSGSPTWFTSETVIAQLLLVRDTVGRRLYSNLSDLAAALRVSEIVPVEVLDEPTSNVLGIMVNLSDYTIGADKGGDVALFDDFDIDYNQYKYLIETRISGALVRAKSALVVLKTASSDVLVDPVAPSYNPTTHAVTVATTTGVVYRNKANNQALTTGSPVTLTEGDELVVIATPANGYHLASTAGDEFAYTYERGRVDAGF